MANIQKKEYDTRTFPEVCSSLTTDQWLVVRERIMSKTRCSKQTICNWKNGKTSPTSILDAAAISVILNRFLGLETNHNFLFPKF